MTTTYDPLTPELRATLRDRYAGKPGLLGDAREEHLAYQYDEERGSYVLIISTTRPATIGDLLDSDATVYRIKEQADYVTAYVEGSEYEAGALLRCRKRHLNLTDEQRAERSERARSAFGHSRPSGGETTDG